MRQHRLRKRLRELRRKIRDRLYALLKDQPRVPYTEAGVEMIAAELRAVALEEGLPWRRPFSIGFTVKP